MKNSVYRKILSITMLLGGMIGVIILQAALLLLMAFATGTDLKSVMNYDPDFMTVFYAAYSVICIIAVCVFRYLAARFSFLRPISAARGSMYDRRITIPGLIALGLALQALSTGLLNIAYSFARDSEVFQNYSDIMNDIDGSTTKSILIYTVFLAPVVEELLFRGLFIDFARYGFSVTASIAITSVCFGLFHGNIIQCCYAIPLGLVLGYVRMCRERLSDSIILHIIINLSSVTVMPVISAGISRIAGETVSYWILSILGAMILAMWLINGKENKPDGEEA